MLSIYLTEEERRLLKIKTKARETRIVELCPQCLGYGYLSQNDLSIDIRGNIVGVQASANHTCKRCNSIGWVAYHESYLWDEKDFIRIDNSEVAL